MFSPSPPIIHQPINPSTPGPDSLTASATRISGLIAQVLQDGSCVAGLHQLQRSSGDLVFLSPPSPGRAVCRKGKVSGENQWGPMVCEVLKLGDHELDWGSWIGLGRKNFKILSYPNISYLTWWFKIGLPPVIIHFRLGFPDGIFHEIVTIQRARGVPPFSKPPELSSGRSSRSASQHP